MESKARWKVVYIYIYETGGSMIRLCCFIDFAQRKEKGRSKEGRRVCKWKTKEKEEVCCLSLFAYKKGIHSLHSHGKKEESQTMELFYVFCLRFSLVSCCPCQNGNLTRALLRLAGSGQWNGQHLRRIGNETATVHRATYFICICVICVFLLGGGLFRLIYKI